MDERTEQGRRFLMGYRDDDTTEFVSDQEKKLPQPPLCKAPMGGERTVLPRDFSALPEGGGLYDLLTRRRSARIYTEGELSLLQLSFLLWATQGVRAMRRRAYATLRTVPSGGARHAFETYLVVRYVEGLRPGAYHYLPMEHALEFLHPVERLEDVVSDTLCGKSSLASMPPRLARSARRTPRRRRRSINLSKMRIYKAENDHRLPEKQPVIFMNDRRVCTAGSCWLSIKTYKPIASVAVVSVSRATWYTAVYRHGT